MWRIFLFVGVLVAAITIGPQVHAFSSPLTRSWFLNVVDITTVLAAETGSPPSYTRASLAATYRCWSFNVDGIGGKCTSPPLILKKNGTYQMSKEKGTYKIAGNTIGLSKSKFRGPGKIVEGVQIWFEYKYKGKQYAVSYLRHGDAPGESSGGATAIKPELTITFDKSNSGILSINSVQLRPKGWDGKIVYDAIAYENTTQSLKAYFKKGIPAQQYDVYVGSGGAPELVGQVDLRGLKGEVQRKVSAKLSSYDVPVAPPAPPVSPPPQDVPVAPPNPVIPPPVPPPQQSPPPPVNTTPCNPNIPRYAQPGCVEL